MTPHDPQQTSNDGTRPAPNRALAPAEWRLLIIAAAMVLAAYALISQLPRWLGW
ncbi:MAG: hypothetical protein MUE68_09640 [Bacteroidetes bacterium]|nr:hypothetical protein [Bacteroidota bacterium]